MCKPRTPWQRFVLSITGVGMIAGMWRWATFHLYTLPPAALAAFTSFTNNAMYVIAAIVIFMVTGKLVYDWKNTTATEVIEEGQQLWKMANLDPKDVDDLSIS